MSLRYAKKQLKRWWRENSKVLLKIYNLDNVICKEVNEGLYRNEWDWREAHPGVKEKLERQREATFDKWFYYGLKLSKIGVLLGEDK